MADDGTFERDLELRQLLQLAHRKLRQNRRVLLENAADLFLSADGRLSDRERSLMSGIVRQLILDVEMLVRPGLAERLAGEKTAPSQLTAALAGNGEGIAYSILAQHGVLNAAELIQVAKHRVREHQLGVAVRTHPNGASPNAMAEAGEGDAMAALSDNADAEIVTRVRTYLVSEAQRLDRFGQPRLRPADLSTGQARALLWWVCAALRQHVLANARMDETKLDSMIQDSAAAAEAALGAGRSIYAEADFVLSILATRRGLDGAFLVQCLRHGRLGAFTAALARLAGADVALVQRILYDLGGEDMAVLCKAAGLDRALFSSLFFWTRAEREGPGTAPATVPNAALRIFDTLSPADAAQALRYWKLDDAYLYAIDKIGQPPPAG